MYQKRVCSRAHKATKAIRSLLVLLAALAPAMAADSQQGSATTPALMVVQALADAAHNLGWPATISLDPHLPGQAWQIAVAAGQHPALRAAIGMAPLPDLSRWLDRLEAQGYSRGLYHGWEAIIARAGDHLCATENPDASCPKAHGLIAWRCGPYGFIAEDTTGSGHEVEIAAALYNAAQERSPYELASSTVIILADTDDTPGSTSVDQARELARSANEYYRVNGYGRVEFSYSILDSDGDAGPRDWYTVGPTLSAYVDDPQGYALAALRAAFSSTNLPPALYLERAIVLYPGDSQQIDSTRPLSSSRCWLGNDDGIQGLGREHTSSVHVPHLILLSEKDALGIWVHELGQAEDQLHDYYLDPHVPTSGSEVGYWDLMGRGDRWGTPMGTSPTQMSSYTRVAAGWLHDMPMALDRDYALTSGENQQMGDAVLTLRDPLGDPQSYYILEARDADAPYGAPRSGLVVYYVTCDRSSGREAVEIVHCPGNNQAIRLGGLVVVVLSESSAPYRVTVRIEPYPAD